MTKSMAGVSSFGREERENDFQLMVGWKLCGSCVEEGGILKCEEVGGRSKSRMQEGAVSGGRRNRTWSLRHATS